MDMMELRRALLQPHIKTIGGLPVLFNNISYKNGNGTANGNANDSTGWFISGFFDTGSTGSKQYIFHNPHSTGSAVRFFNNKNSRSVDWWSMPENTDRIVTSVGRYITLDIFASKAADYYIYDQTNGRYVFKGKNVT